MTDDALFQPDQISPADGEIKIIDLVAAPYQDLQRVKVKFRLTFFHEPLNATINLSGIDGKRLISVDMVNLIQSENEVTLHIPKAYVQNGDYQVELVLFQIKEREEPGEGNSDIHLTTQVLTSQTITFSIP